MNFLRIIARTLLKCLGLFSAQAFFPEALRMQHAHYLREEPPEKTASEVLTRHA